MAPPDCPERVRLGRKVAETISAVHSLKDEFSESPKDASLAILLDQARTAQREAERALRNHIREHRCVEVKA